jgi:hypothetical protein
MIATSPYHIIPPQPVRFNKRLDLKVIKKLDSIIRYFAIYVSITAISLCGILYYEIWASYNRDLHMDSVCADYNSDPLVYKEYYNTLHGAKVYCYVFFMIMGALSAMLGAPFVVATKKLTGKIRSNEKKFQYALKGENTFYSK